MREVDAETEERILTFMESMAPEQTAFLDRIEQEALDEAVPIIRTQTRSLLQFLMLAERPRRILEIGTGTGFSACVMLTYAPTDAELVTIEKDPHRARKARENFAAFRAQTQTDSAAFRKEGGNPSAAADCEETGPVTAERKETGPDATEHEETKPDAAAERITGVPAGSTFEGDPADQKGMSARQTQAQRPAVSARIGRVTLLEGDAAQILPGWNGEYDFIFMDGAKGQYLHYLPDVLRMLRPGGMLLSDNIFKEGEILESRYAVQRRNRTIHKRMREYLSALTRDPALQTLLLQEGDGAALTLKKPAEV